MTFPLQSKWTFQSQAWWQNGAEWVSSSGRWDTQDEAAQAAAKWLIVCAENGMCPAVRVHMVEELDTFD
jgi:hypothetical protein